MTRFRIGHQPGLILMVTFLCCLSGATAITAQTIVINELLASNQAVNLDEDGDASDWLELYNAGTQAVNLSGYTITDNAGQPAQWVFPEITLAPASYLLVWASGKNRPDPAHLHTNFKLGGSGEFLGLFDPTGAVVDSLTFGAQTTDVSYGRLPDGSVTLVFMQTPTPAAANRGDAPPVINLIFSQPQGVYQGSVTVALSTNHPTGEIRYTLTGDEPTPQSNRYTQPLTFTRTTVLRARVFAGGTAQTRIVSGTYILNDRPNLPIIVIATAPANLWDPDIGIYANPQGEGEAWERPVDVALIENGVTQFAAPAGIRIHGNSSRVDAKKSLRLYFRSDYGQSTLDYRVFPQKPIDKFKRLVLYAPSGDQATGSGTFTMINDALTHSLWHEVGGAISAFRPAALYLNHEYWGVYWIRERIDDEYIESNYGITDMDLHRSQWGTSEPELREGDAVFWDETFAFFEHNDLRVPANYERVKSRYAKLENFTDYHIMNIFGANWDWPHNNLDRCHDRAGDPRWFWIMWDTGAAWRHAAPDHPTLAWATRDQVRTDIKFNDDESLLWSTLMLRRLLANGEYRRYFINRFADLINTTLSSRNVESHLNQLVAMIAPEMERELTRWGVEDHSVWERNLNAARNFIHERPAYQREQLMQKFGLSGMATVTILPPEGEGQVTLNTITPADLPWQGEYFRGIPITVKATPSPGYTFERWSDASLPAQAEISLTLNRDLALQAIFSTETDTFFISDLKIGPVTANAATLVWRTNKAAQTQIEYGTTAAYGQQTPWTGTFLTRHEITLSGLTPDTRYHFRVRNRDREGNEVNSPDSVFTTLAFTPVRVAARVEIDPHNEWEFFTCRVFNLSEVARLTQVVIAGQDESAFDLFRNGNRFAVTPDVEENNDNVTSQAVTLTFAGGGLAPGASDSNGEDNDLDWLTRRVQITVHFDDGNVLSGEAVNEGDTDDGNPDLWAVALSLNGAPEVKRGETSVATRSALPQAFALAPNYPNPFNAGTLWPLDLPENGLLRAVIYNLQGQRVAELSDQRWQAGRQTLRWEGTDSSGRTVSSGIYLLRLFFEGESGSRQVVTRRLVFLR